MTSLADHIREDPVLLSLLKMLERHVCEFRAPKSASEEDSDHGIVAFTSHRATIKDGEEPLALLARQPVAEAYAMLFRSFHTADSGGQIRTKQPGICRFVPQSPNRREPKVDGRCSVAFLFQIDAIASDDGPVESEPRFRAIPVNEVANGVVLRALRARGCEAVENCGSGLFQVRKSQDCFGVALTFRFGHARIFFRARLYTVSKPEARFTGLIL